MQNLYDLVGEEGFHKLSKLFYDKVLNDPLLIPLFKDPDEPHAERFALYLIERFGGPQLHSMTRGGLRTAIAVHYGLKISEEQRARWVEYMRESVDECDFPYVFKRQFYPYIEMISRQTAMTSHGDPVDVGL